MIPETALMVTKGTPIAKYNVDIQNIGFTDCVSELLLPMFKLNIKEKESLSKASFRIETKLKLKNLN